MNRLAVRPSTSLVVAENVPGDTAGTLRAAIAGAVPLSVLLAILLLGPLGCAYQSGESHSQASQQSTGDMGNNTADVSANNTITLTIIGTNDVHGQLTSRKGIGGLSTFSGYVDNLRKARSMDGGAVLLIDAGDMWQGTLESNLSEGAVMLEAFNALGFTAAAIGNHEFDFGPVGPRATPQSSVDDARGALKQRASEAAFPLLAANLIDETTGLPVDWPNVKPSILINVGGVKVGIIGVMTIEALSATISANTRGLRVAPLAPTITEQATSLRARGAQLVIVTAHAGGQCDDFSDPLDLSSCEQDAEIMQVARNIPPNLVNHIIAGHRHRGMAHEVNEIVVTSNFGSTRTFGRVDFMIDKDQMKVTDRKIFPPQATCPRLNAETGECDWTNTDSASTRPVVYEGYAVKPMYSVSKVVERAVAQATELKQQEVGIYLDTPFTVNPAPESALGNIFLQAMLETSGADVAIHNVSGGLRANLPEGKLTYGDVYQMFPFDNRVVVLNVTGKELRRIAERQARKPDRRAGITGFRAYAECTNSLIKMKLILDNGREVLDGDQLKLTVNDFLAYGGDDILIPIIPEGGLEFADDTPLARDEFVRWLKALGTDAKRATLGHINQSEYDTSDRPHWNVSSPINENCAL